MSRIFKSFNSKIVVNGALASFVLYFCMYAFRKPFSVATFEGLQVLGIDYKILLILTQVVGYMSAKFIGIKIVSSLRPSKRAFYLVAMILTAEVSLVLFGLVTKPYNISLFFFNGLSLGMIWGIVFSYLEGRKTTEILSIILCSSFIVSSGAVKSVGFWIMNSFGVSEFWMPALTGLLFLPLFFISLWFLEQLPPPSAEDKLMRKERKPMNGKERILVFKRYFFPLVILIFFYTALTALRDFRDNFSRELWDSIGYKDNAGIYTLSELPVAILVLTMLGLFGFIKNNSKAFIGFHWVLIFCSLLIALATFLFQYELISPILWMILIGFGLYACYVPFNSIFFDRMIATFHINGNAGFLIYLADSFGYLGSMAVLLYKNFGETTTTWLYFFMGSIYFISILGVIIPVVSLIHFKNRILKKKDDFEPKILISNG